MPVSQTYLFFNYRFSKILNNAVSHQSAFNNQYPPLVGRVTCDECPSSEGRQKFCTWRGARMIEGMRFKDDCKICSCKEGEIACEVRRHAHSLTYLMQL